MSLKSTLKRLKPRPPTLSVGFFRGFYDRLNNGVYAAQEWFAAIYNEWFTFKFALIIAMVMGGGFAFIGGDCYGRVQWISPVSVCLALVALFFLFQTFVIVLLTLGRIFRIFLMGLCGHYLAYQAYAFWSLENLADKTVEVFQGANICQPYVYANIPYGYGWAFIPAVLIVLTAFFFPEGESDEDEYEDEYENQLSMDFSEKRL